MLFVLLAAFTAWAYFQAFLISPFPGNSLNELRGQWLMQLTVFLTAIIVVKALSGNMKAVLMAVYWGIWFLLFALFVMSMWRWSQTGALPDRWGGLPGTLRTGLQNMSMTTVAFWMFMLADLIARIKSGSWYFQRSTLGWLAVLALTLFGLYIQNMRTALIAIVLVSVVVAVFLLSNMLKVGDKWRWRRIVGSFALAVVAFALVATYVSRDPRWGSLMATVPIAWHIHEDTTWATDTCKADALNCKLPNGQVVGVSNYLRIAWLHASLDEFFRNPLGIGYSRQAFGNALNYDHPDYHTVITRANNSVLTLAIGVGVPGFLLMMGFLFYLSWLGYVKAVQGQWVFMLLPLLVMKTLIAGFSRFVMFNSNMEFLMFIFGVFTAALIGISQQRTDGAYKLRDN
ncbi:hypothetical protein BW247_12550 [Acidihalobacter ferrooxydans]|uniref:O-antigen ligase-related domain-containing protein n=2 Tax=Acidihalobacter ferrooxydans TaxID=1765967 RepID=A0A1P8UIY9_9GAMM|nr:hypothetical protein BW247_12550 [Acidihalobacter ferrooxydans]